MSDLEQQLKILKMGYIKKLRDSFPEFEALLSLRTPDINEVYTKVHTISGTSGMYGIMDLSEISSEFEIYLKEQKANIDMINYEDLKSKLSTYVENLSSIIFAGE